MIKCSFSISFRLTVERERGMKWMTKKNMYKSIFLAPCLSHISFSHPPIYCSIPAPSCRTIRLGFVLGWTLRQHWETSETGKGLVRGIFNLCHSSLQLYVPCLLAQLTAPNMVQRWARLQQPNTRGETKGSDGIVLPRWSGSTQDAAERREKPALRALTWLCSFAADTSE